MKKLLAVLLTGALFQNAIACTAIDIKAQDGSVVAGRTMEWAFDNMEWTLLFYPKNTSYTLSAPADTKLPQIKMTSKYAVLGIGSEIAKEALVEGQNSAGLSASGNFLPGFSKFQQVTTKDKKYVAVTEFIRFVLSNYATVQQVQAELPKYKVWLPSLANSPEQATMHFLFTDKSGANIVVEFVNGEMKIYDKTSNVMTNSPTYDWHMTNIRNYINISNQAVAQRQTDTLGDITNVSQGGGGIGLPGDYMSPSRFVKASFLVYYSDKAKNAADAVSLTTHILDTVDIPKGVVSSKSPDGQIHSDYTQWVSIKDLSNNKLYFSDYDHRNNYVTIDLNTLDAQSKAFVLPLDQIKYPSNEITTTLVK